MAIVLDKNELVLTLKVMAKNPLSVIGSLIAIVFLGSALLVEILGDRVAPFSPNALNLNAAYSPPSLAHLMGTDQFGRDILSRVIVATPIDAEIALVIVGASMVIGILMGSASGYFGGRIDEVLMRITDLFIAFPSLVLAVAIAVALGPGVDHVIEANLVAWWPIYTRLARAGALSLRGSQFVEAAKVAGHSHFSIILRHIIPNNVSPIIVYATLDIGNAIIYSSVLSYLGLGAQPPQAEWGAMVYSGQNYLASNWWMAILPGLVIFAVALGFNLLGDALRDAMDPRYRK